MRGTRKQKPITNNCTIKRTSRETYQKPSKFDRIKAEDWIGKQSAKETPKQHPSMQRERSEAQAKNTECR